MFSQLQNASSNRSGLFIANVSMSHVLNITKKLWLHEIVKHDMFSLFAQTVNVVLTRNI